MRKCRLRTSAGMLALSAMVCLGAALTPANVSAATEHFNDAASSSKSWETYKNNWTKTSSNLENVSLTPGTDETQLNCAWYSQKEETPVVLIATSEIDLKGDDSDTSKVQRFEGTQTKSDVDGYFSNKVVVTGLAENTDYYYQIYQNGEWKSAESYSTHSFSNFSFLYVGDPQIGASNKQTSEDGTALTEKDDNLAARNDSYNWNVTLNSALKDHEDVSFMLSAGDQVNTGSSEAEYAGYLSANALKSLPVSTTIGNHDSGSIKYTNHFNNPNAFSSDQTEYTTGQTKAGTDYYYTYGDVLFIVLDTNNYNCATHKNVIEKAVSENKDKKWRVVMFHQDIYGSGYDHSDSDGIVLRTQLTPIMDEYDIDVVLQGHDHTYSRTYQLKGDGKEHKSYDKSNYRDDDQYQNENLCYTLTSDQVGGTITNPDGTVYFEANSATGSKFYNLISTKQDYISERSQKWSPTYSVVSVTADTFSVTTYDVKTGKELKGSSTYTIKKTSQTPDDTNKVTAPKKASITKATRTSKTTAKVSWKKVSGAKGYKVVYSTSKSFKNAKSTTVKSGSTTSKKLTKLTKNKKYYVKVRAYKTDNNGKKVYGSYSSVKTIKAK